MSGNECPFAKPDAPEYVRYKELCGNWCALYLEAGEVGAPMTDVPSYLGGGCSIRVIAVSLAEVQAAFAKAGPVVNKVA